MQGQIIETLSADTMIVELANEPGVIWTMKRKGLLTLLRRHDNGNTATQDTEEVRRILHGGVWEETDS